MEPVLTTRSSSVYHRQGDCPRLLAEVADGALPGLTEAVLAYHYGRKGCRDCTHSFDSKLRCDLVDVPPQHRSHSEKIPLESVYGPEAGGWHGDVEVPYGPAGEPQDIRFSVHTTVDWGTYTYGQHPDEYLGEPTDDDHDWGRGPSRYLD